ncbi:hypothetical protein M3Y97_00776300 [Aphelenchoides bicaudatus]|nr:hypothetical protein M3Y97_00776300 [Aphelenchoides bicaudatus]
MNEFYAHHYWQASSSPVTSHDESSLSPPSSTNHSGDYNLTTSSFSHYTCSSIQPVRPDLIRNLSDPRLDFHRHQPYTLTSTTHATKRGGAQSPIKRPIVTSLTNRQPPRTPRHKWKRHHKRSDSSSSEEVQQIAITIPRSILDQNRCSDSRSRSDEGFCASEEKQTDSDEFEDGKTDFMNATDKIYENLCVQQQHNAQPNASLPRLPPPDTRRSMIQEDESLIYGRLTALILSNARSNPKTRCKISQTQAEIKVLLQIPTHTNLCVEDQGLFSRNCALFGHQVAAQLRQLNERSPAEFQLQVKKLHKLLYSIKKKNVILGFGAVGRFVQRILKAI